MRACKSRTLVSHAIDGLINYSSCCSFDSFNLSIVSRFSSPVNLMLHYQKVQWHSQHSMHDDEHTVEEIVVYIEEDRIAGIGIGQSDVQIFISVSLMYITDSEPFPCWQNHTQRTILLLLEAFVLPPNLNHGNTDCKISWFCPTSHTLCPRLCPPPLKSGKATFCCTLVRRSSLQWDWAGD